MKPDHYDGLRDVLYVLLHHSACAGRVDRHLLFQDVADTLAFARHRPDCVREAGDE